MATTARGIDASAVFRAIYTACPNDPTTLLLDVRPNKEYKKRHINQAFNVRLSSNGQVLADYSQSSYSVVWSQAVWWGKPVIVYGHADLSKSHPVVNFLVQEGRCAAVLYYRDGYEAFEKQYPFLCTASVKANSIKRYPSQVLDLLYLGDWGHAQDQERLDEIKVRRIITIHNNPENLKPPPHVQHLRFTLADIDTADISRYFNTAYEFIDDAMRKGQGVLVHCGAGVSRSACLVMMYLMRSKHWSAQKAREYVIERRSIVCPNDGFWRTLCSLEAGLGIIDRSDPTATSGFHGVDAPAAQLSADAVGVKVQVQFAPAAAKAQQQAAAAAGGRGHDRREEESGSGRDRLRDGEEHRGAERRHEQDGGDRDRGRERRRSVDRRGRSRSRSRSRERIRSVEHRRDRDGSRERGREHGRRHSRDRSSDRRRNGDGSARQGVASPATGTGATGNTHAAAAAAQPGRVSAGASGGWELAFEVSKPEAVLGELVLGPCAPSVRIVFGRDPGCEVVLEHLSVSRRHAQLGVDATGNVSVTDLDSAHGTKVGEVWVKPHAPRTLAVGTALRFGASTRTYKLLQVRGGRSQRLATTQQGGGTAN